MENDNITQVELMVWLETLAENVELKAKSGKDAAEIIREKADRLKMSQCK